MNCKPNTLKRFLKSFIVFFSIFLVCGCTTNEQQTTIQFATWGSKSEIDILKPIIDDFEKQNPEIKVDLMHIPQNYFQKIHLLLASNTAPDVIFINNLNLPIYADHLYQIDAETEIFYPQSIQALSYKEKLYAIPRDVSNLVIYYNKDIFRKKNIPYPTKDWTFEKFLEIAQKLTDENTFGISFEEDPFFYLPYLMSNGGGFLPEEINKSESQKAIEFYANLRNKYHVAPQKPESASATMAQMFLQERIAMYLSGRWMMPKLLTDAKFEWDVAQFPKGTKGSIVQLDASGWAITNSSKHKNEALKLVKYLSSKDSSEKFVQSGLIIPARKDTSKLVLDNKTPKNAQIFIDIIETSIPTPVTKDYKQILDNLQKILEPKFNIKY